MCGRMNIIHDKLCPIISNFFGLNFTTPTNSNLSPSQTVATIVSNDVGFLQLETSWGIQPNWSKKWH
ncbi:MAG: hypothetical protein HRT38_19415 [Alteromonadaceae bacterium]|nr:hypothetical protein [Alteromonadaceae bacterium]